MEERTNILDQEMVTSIISKRYSNKVTQAFCDHICVKSGSCEKQERGERCTIGE